MFCKNCEFELEKDTSEKKESIWDFEPRNYETYKEFAENFEKLFKNLSVEKLLEKNEDGYTYFHWYIYFVGKTGKYYEKTCKKVLWIFTYLENNPNLTKFLTEGTLEDSQYTCLHHLYKYCDNSHKKRVIEMEKYLIKNGCNPLQVDADGFTYLDYKLQKAIPVDYQNFINHNIKIYKTLEKKFCKNIFFLYYSNFFTFCEKCRTEINFVQDLEKLSENGIYLNKFQTQQLLSIVRCREKVTNIYKIFQFDEDLLHNHQYIINIYKKLLENKINKI